MFVQVRNALAGNGAKSGVCPRYAGWYEMVTRARVESVENAVSSKEAHEACVGLRNHTPLGLFLIWVTQSIEQTLHLKPACLSKESQNW